MPDIRFYNTLINDVQRFEPIDPPHVYMYNCGPTVYDYAHIGNFKTFLFADVLRRFLELVGYNVHQVMNITDVGHMTEDQLADGGGEDKMQAAARRLKEAKKQGDAHARVIGDPDDPYQIAEFYIQAFLEDARALGITVADEYPQHVPRASAYVEQMQAIIKRLIDAEHAYVTDDGTVYYSVESFPEYGRLSGNTLDKLRGGAGGRVDEAHQAVKRHPADFLLWKPDPSHLMKWDSPWGVGYPGWHIECSAMATTLLGRDIIDIHTGGEDNIFPHHECEIAQTRGATGNDSFARCWMHSRHLLVEGEKMAKSKGNFFTVRDVLQGKFTGRPVDPTVLRFELIKANYRSTMNFSRQSIYDSARAVEKVQEWWWNTRRTRMDPAFLREVESFNVDTSHPMVSWFEAFLADDLNTSGAIGFLFEWMKGEHKDPVESIAVFEKFDDILGIGPLAQLATSFSQLSKDDPLLHEKCNAIDKARAEKDFATADRIRAELIDAGYDVKTTNDGTVATKKLA